MKSSPAISAFTLGIAAMLTLAGFASSSSYLHAQTVSEQSPAGQSSSAADEGAAMERGNPQRTGVYRATGALPSGETAWSSKKLFDIEATNRPRGKAEFQITYMGRSYNLRGDHIDGPYSGFDYSEPVVSGDTLYFVINLVRKRESQLMAVDTRTGHAKLISKRSNGWYSAPTVAGDTLYVGADSGHFYAVDLKTNSEKWRHQRGDDSFVIPSPLIYGRLLFYTSSHGGLYALNAETGKLLWVFSTQSDLTPPAADDETVYFSGYNTVYALDMRTGKERWRFRTKKALSSVVVAGGIIYFRDEEEGYIHRLDARTGEALPKPKRDNQAATRLAVEGQTIYFGGWDSGTIFAADALSGEIRWKYTVTAEIHCKAPVVAGDNLYMTCDDGRLYALDKLTGKKRWMSEQQTPDLSPPTVADGMVFFISNNGKVYAVR